MSRPAPKIILETRDDDYNATQVLKADTVYAIYYGDQPVALRTRNALIDYPGPKYKKTTFNNSAHGFNRVDELNSAFNTTKFNLREMADSKIVTRDIQPRSTAYRKNKKKA